MLFLNQLHIRHTALALVLGIVVIQPAWSSDPKRECQLSRDDNIFEPSHWPEADLRKFASGQLGIVRPSYVHFFLFMVYRQLTGQAFSEREKEILFQHEPCKIDPARGYHGYDVTQSESYQNAISRWITTRQRVISTPLRAQPKGYRENPQYGYDEFLNCNEDAFATASHTLESRIATYGNGEDVANWVRGQDAVFSDCAAHPRLPKMYPDRLHAGCNPIARINRLPPRSMRADTMKR